MKRILTTLALFISTISIAQIKTIKVQGSGIGSQWRDTTAGIYYPSGNVGIGTLNPATKLHTIGTVRHQSLAVSNDTTLKKPLSIDANGNIYAFDYWPSGGGGGGGGSQTFPQVLATGRTFLSSDSVLLGGQQFFFKNGLLKSESVLIEDAVTAQLNLSNPSPAAGAGSQLKFSDDRGTDARIALFNSNSSFGGAFLPAGSMYQIYDGIGEMTWLNIGAGDMTWKTAYAGYTTKMRLRQNGVFELKSYGSGAVTSTPTFGLAVDNVGNVIEVPLGGGGSPASPANSVQYNNAGSFGGSANMTFDGSTLSVAPYTTKTSINIGSFGLQSYSVNNSWLSDNLYYNGTAWKYKGDGYGLLNYFNPTGYQIGMAPNNTLGADATATLENLFEVGYNGLIKFDKYGAGTFTGTPEYTLGVTSAGAIVEVGLTTTLGVPVISNGAITPTGVIFHVTGTTAITRLNGINLKPGTITLIFDDNVIVRDANNLQLNGMLRARPGTTLVGAWDGNMFYETSRSIN